MIDRNKINRLLEGIYSDFFNYNEWAHVKLQSLLEYVLEDFTEEILNIQVNDFSTLGDLIGPVFSDMLKKSDLDVLYKCNTKANKVKHGNVLENFDKKLISQFIRVYNDFIKIHYGARYSFLILDDNLNFKKLSIDKPKQEAKYFNLNSKPILPVIKPEILSYHLITSKNDMPFRLNNIVNQNNIDEDFNKAIYANIHNIIIKSNSLQPSEFVNEAQEIHGRKLNLKLLAKVKIIILNLIRYGYTSNNKLAINFVDFDSVYINTAIGEINYFYRLLNSLTSMPSPPLEIYVDSSEGVKILNSNNGDSIFIEEFEIEDASIINPLWIYDDPKYKVDMTNHHKQLSQLLNEFFGYNTFKKGQLEAVCGTINNKNSLTILPTGGGKTIVYLFNILLSNKISIILSPTEVLIDDQLRNLDEEYNISNVGRIKFLQEIDSSCFQNQIIYMTPRTLQRKDLIYNVIDLTTKNYIFNLVLDEVHTICNWSHDFRPEYLMLSKNIKDFMDNCRYLGFTATANYKVVSDLQYQLNIDDNNVIAPITFNIQNHIFKFKSFDKENDKFEFFINEIRKFTSLIDNNKMIVFVKDIEKAKNLWEQLAYYGNHDTNYLDDKHTIEYEEFINNIKNILIAEAHYGIGLNIPNVVKSIHYGFPLSKSEFVQEIGRINRENNYGESSVLFKEFNHFTNIEMKIMDYSISTDDIKMLIKEQETQSDLVDSFKKLFNDIDNYSYASNEVISLCKKLKPNVPKQVFNIKSKDHPRIAKYLYILKIIGVVDNYYYLRNSNDKITSLQIESHENFNNVDWIKSNTIKYLNQMGSYDKFVFEIKKAKSINEVIFTVMRWFYNEFLYYHREQLMNIVEFFDYSNETNETDKIAEGLKNYFALSVEDIKKNYEILKQKSIKEILNMKPAEITNYSYFAEELNLLYYDFKLDLILLMHQINRNKRFDMTRLSRILASLDNRNRDDFVEKLANLYIRLSNEDKFEIVTRLASFYTNIDIIKFLYNNENHLKIKKDKIYVYLVVEPLNKKMGALFYV